jgi:pimeloyl-ACP methyl ester carboxylesterase
MPRAPEAFTPPLARGRKAPLLGLVRNRPQQEDGLFHGPNFDLAIVEFDDQGRCYHRAQMDELANKLAELSSTDAIIVAFVHGWKHNAKSDDDNLADFLGVLRQAVEREHEASIESQTPARPVLGVFVAWRGMSLHGLGLENLTFWDRQAAGRRVAVGSVRELLGRIRRYRNQRLGTNGGKPLFVVAGHSFGGMIVFSALAQSLIESALTARDKIVPGFADLVILINPAFEAGRYMPLYDLIEARRQAGAPVAQPPVFVCATATNDYATGVLFPIGNLYTLLTESFRGFKEFDTAIRTPGHVPWMATHRLMPNGESPGYRRDTLNESDDNNPFWIIEADPAIINGHNGIFLPRFMTFLSDLVFAHVRKSRNLDFTMPRER